MYMYMSGLIPPIHEYNENSNNVYTPGTLYYQPTSIQQ